MENFLEKELSYKVVGCFYDTRNKYGSGHNEKVYHRALAEQFEMKGIKYFSEPKIRIHSVDTGKVISLRIPDFLVENTILVELKARPFGSEKFYKQTIEYLKCSEYEIAYLVNFGEEEFSPKRIIYTNDRKDFISLIKN